MKPGLEFEKWEGLGNDFVVVESEPTLDDVRSLCDRRRGVGADGVLWVNREPPRMIVFNADGSRPEMCGNGLRCVAAYLARPGQREVVIQTDAGPRACLVERDPAAPNAARVAVDMGVARFGPELSRRIGDAEHTFSCVDVGNPHAITFGEVEPLHYQEVGSTLEQQTPGGVNVEFVRAQPERLDVVVWERGVGFTQACGTGACAVAAAACRDGRASYGAPVRVGLPGGELTIEVSVGDSGATGPIRMTGPARRVFAGIFNG
ncbi:MAG: diaminopimelate epimerase [Polyangiaceae bacterium]|jgi:diaminopimelate epimerase|nr:diaminopimelate epimerase [Polyangiaceae bacterium]MBK8938318.1 diaminopimelate epimerase [Polyangiaceae bacterium]